MIVAGVDLAFRHNASALAIARAEGGRVRVSGLREWRPGRVALRPSVVCGEIVDAALDAGAERIIADGHYVDTLLEIIAGRMGHELAPSPSESWQLTAQGMREGLVSIEPHDRLRAQLEAVRFTYEAEGRVSVQKPVAADGSHGDLADAVNLAVWWGLSRGGGGPERSSVLQLFGGRRKRGDVPRGVR